jgi:transposase
VILSRRERKRLHVISKLDAGRVTGREAAEFMGVSLRQARQLLAASRQKGVEAVVHGNRGRAPATRTSEVIRDRVLISARTTYHDYNDQHFTEELAEHHGIVPSRSTVRRIRRQAESVSPRTRRFAPYRRRRERYPQAGMLLQIDGSDREWPECPTPNVDRSHRRRHQRGTIGPVSRTGRRCLGSILARRQWALF